MRRTARMLWGVVLVIVGVVGCADRENEPAVFVCFALLLFTGVVLDSWLIIGTLAGACCGFLFQPLVHIGPRDVAAWDTFGVHFYWIAAGVLFGFLMDFVRRSPPSDTGRRAS